MTKQVSTEECRRILGVSANGMTDAEVETMRDELERTADMLFNQIAEGGREGLYEARRDSHFRETGEGE
jgi:hypothetical protein